MQRPVGLVKQWRPGAEVASAVESGKLKGTWQEKHCLQAPCVADGLQ